MSAPGKQTGFTLWILRMVEPPIFHWRKVTLTILTLLTLFFGYHMAQLKPAAGWLKMVPQQHEYMQTFLEYYKDFGGANTVLVALHTKEGDIYTPKFMETLRAATDEVFFVPGIDRARVTSLFTPNILYVEVVEGGLAGETVIPRNYQATDEFMPTIRANVGKANVVGRLVSEDYTSALIVAELLDKDPVTNEPLDYVAVGGKLEEIRNRFESPKRYELRATEDYEDFKAGDVVAIRYVEPQLFPGQTVLSDTRGEGVAQYQVPTSKLEVTEHENPFYDPSVSIHMIGFAKVVDDMTDAAFEVGAFFVISLVLTSLLLWAYLGSFRLSLLPMGVSLIAVVWELGLCHIVGLGLDPFAILVPFLILSVSVSHGVQYVNFWAQEITHKNADSYHASLGTFRLLAIPGAVALITNVAGFATIYLIDIDVIREMSINAAFGMAGIIITNKVVMPQLLTYMKLGDVEAFKRAQEKRERMGDALFRQIAKFTRRGPALMVLAVCVALSVWAGFQYPKLRIGDTTFGVPELRPDSRFNQDAATIAAHFALGVDQFKVIAETIDDACIDYQIMAEVDRFGWYMKNQAGVRDVVSLLDLSKLAYAGLNEGRLNAEVLPRNRFSLAQSTALVPTTTGFYNDDCDALAVFIFTTDHKAETITALVQAVKDYQANENSDPRVKFRLASGNVGVMAATNEVVHEQEFAVVAWVYVVIVIFLWLSFRTISGVLCCALPLALVTILGYAQMVVLDIGLKVATLPVLALAAGIGVDYGIYIYSVMAEQLRRKVPLEEAYFHTLQQVGKAVIFTALALAVSVITWLLSKLQFQADMGKLLVFAYITNVLGAVLVLPALAHFLAKEELKHAGETLTAGAENASLDKEE